MRLRRCPGGVTVSTLSRHVRGLGFHFRVRTPFSIYLWSIYLVFTFVLRLLSACTVHLSVVLRSRSRALLIPNLNRTSPATITP